jgi:hypothetical protein
MADTALRRFQELVQKELGAVDARAELGGRDPSAPELVFKNLQNGFRIVAVFEGAPADRDDAQTKLDRLAESFSHTLGELHAPLLGHTAASLPARRLSDALEALRARTGAVSAVVIDGNSPVLWGSSDAERDLVDVDSFAKIGQALHRARDKGLTLDQLPLHDASALLAMLPGRGIDRVIIEALSLLVTTEHDESTVRHRLLTALAIASVRARMHRGEQARSVHHEAQFGYIARGFANIYSIIVVFAGPFSELHVESAVLHTLPAIEELLFALPPVDPPPGKGQVIRLRPRS